MQHEFKILSKIIMNHLKHIIDYLISPYQSGFIPGRRIRDNIVIAK